MVPQHLDVKTIAERLCVSRRAVYEWIQLGELPAIRLGRRVVVNERDLARWLENRRLQSRGPLGDHPVQY